VRLKLAVTDKKNVERKVDAECEEALYEAADKKLTLKGVERATVVEPHLERTTSIKCSSAVLKLDTGDYDFFQVEIQITQPEKGEQPAKS
jgi:hypothetical protein